MKAEWILRMNSASSCIACCIFHIISIPFNCSDTAIRVAKTIIGAKVIILCFTVFALFLEFRATTRLRPFLISETGLKFLIWTQGEIGPGQPGSCEEAIRLNASLPPVRACMGSFRRTVAGNRAYPWLCPFTPSTFWCSSLVMLEIFYKEIFLSIRWWVWIRGIVQRIYTS